jgi:hypothetical protein
MRSTARVVIVFSVMIAGLIALASMAGARGRLADARDPQRLAALAAMDEALARYDVPAAVQAWRQARDLGLRSRGWRGPAEAADAELRLAAVIERVDEAKRNARELWLVALFRARAEGAVDGALDAAEGFARLGDRDASVLALRIADKIAARNGAEGDRAHVRLVAERLARPAAAPASTPSGS